MNAGDRKQTEEVIDIETEGGTAEVDMHGATLLSLAIRGDGVADYVLDARLSRSDSWIEDVSNTSYAGDSDYDDVIEAGVPSIRVRCTSGTGGVGDTATISLSAGGG